jgi:succinate dehydrogenase / fumarate reductase flavoprotein subunit
VARAIETEIREGRGITNPDHQIEHVWIDLRHLSDYVHKIQIPEVTGFFKKFVNLDPKVDLCPVRPSVHYHMGGIPTNEFGNVQKRPGEHMAGLFAIGECGAASFHGFNRLGTNSILELITMGKFAGEQMMDYIGEDVEEPPPGAGEKTLAVFARLLNQTRPDSLGRIRHELQKTMTEKVGIFRTEQGLTEGIEALQELKERADKTALSSKSLVMNQELIQHWELSFLLEVAMVCASSALYRKESRGGHFRDDFPERKDEFNHHTLAYLTEHGTVQLEKRPVDMSLYEAGDQHFEKFNLIERKY